MQLGYQNLRRYISNIITNHTLLIFRNAISTFLPQMDGTEKTSRE